MDNKKVGLILEESSLEYYSRLSPDGNVTDLFTSGNPVWNNPNTKVARLFDTGTGVMLAHEDFKDALTMNYSQAVELYYILRAYVKTDKNLVGDNMFIDGVTEEELGIAERVQKDVESV